MKLNQRFLIALNTVAFLRATPVVVTAQQISTTLGVSYAFLEQILRQLRIAKIVNVKRGPGGGFWLNTKADLTAYTVAKAIGVESFDVTLDGVAGLLSQSMVDVLVKTAV